MDLETLVSSCFNQLTRLVAREDFIIYKLINSIWNKEELPKQWKESIIVQIYMRGDKTD
jgi:hypothetical protein